MGALHRDSIPSSGSEPRLGAASRQPPAGSDRAPGSAGTRTDWKNGLATSFEFLATEGPSSSVRGEGPAHTFGSTLP